MACIRDERDPAAQKLSPEVLLIYEIVHPHAHGCAVFVF